MAETIAALTIYEFVAIVASVMMTASRVLAARGHDASPSNDPNANQSRGQLINTCDSQRPLPLIYGQQRVGGNRVYSGTTGANAKRLHLIYNLCEGEVRGIRQVGGVDQVFLNDRLYNAYGSLVHYEFFNGSATQNVCATLHAAIPEWNECKRYTCYIYISLDYDENVFQSLPEVTVEIEGLKVYDPVTETTAYSRNPALHGRDFITRSSRRGGMGFAGARVSELSAADDADYSTARGCFCDLAVTENQAAIDNFSQILSCFRGALIYADSLYKIKYRDLNYESIAMNLTEDDVVEIGGKSSLKITQPSIFDTPNAVNIRYPNLNKKYQLDNYVFSDPSAIAADGDYREKAIDLPGVINQSNIMKMANYFLESFRRNKKADLVIGSRGMPLEPFDLITLTHSRPGWTAKQFRIAEAKLNANLEVGLNLEEEYASFYDDTYEISERAWHDTTLPDPSAAVSCVINVSHAEEVYNYRGRSFTRWKIDFDRPESESYPWWDHADIYIKVGAGDWKFMTKSGGDYMIDPVEEGVTYYCNIVSVSIWGTKQAFDDGMTVSKTIVGKTSLPGNIPAITAVAHGDSVSIFATLLSDPDIAGYEVRLGASWNGGLFIGFNETPNIRLTGVRPGTHTFWMAAKDNSGRYSESPASAQVTVFYPANYVNKNVWSWDFDAIGTFDNTEHAAYAGGDALKCRHTDGVLTGKWTSPEYDLGSVKTVRIWGDFLTALDASTGTWDSLFPSGASWNDKTPSATRWYQLFSPAYAGILQAKLFWGTSSGNLTESTEKMEILAPEIEARYVRVEITVIDPDAASYLYLKTLNMTAAYWS